MFKFSLQSLKDYRETLSSTIEREYQLLLGNEEKAQIELYELRDQYVDTKDQMMEHLVAGRYQHERLYTGFLEGIKQKIVDKLAEIHEIKSLIEVKKLELIKSKKQEKILEEIYKRELKQNQEKFKHIEGKELDEFSSFKHGNKSAHAKS